MSEISPTAPAFRQTKNGYEPADVHAHIDELNQRLVDASGKVDTERRRAEEAERAADAARDELRELERRAGLPGYEAVAERLRAILEAADQAATELRTRAQIDAETSKRQAEDRSADILAEARVEADAALRRGQQEAAKAIAEAERRVQVLRGEIAQLEHQRDRALDALGSLRDRLTRAAQDLLPSGEGREHHRWGDNVASLAHDDDDRRDPQQRLTHLGENLKGSEEPAGDESEPEDLGRAVAH